VTLGLLCPGKLYEETQTKGEHVSVLCELLVRIEGAPCVLEDNVSCRRERWMLRGMADDQATTAEGEKADRGRRREMGGNEDN